MNRIARKPDPRLAAIASLGVAAVLCPTGAYASVIASSSPIVVPIGTNSTYAAVNEYPVGGDPTGTGSGVTNYTSDFVPSKVSVANYNDPISVAYDTSGNLYMVQGGTITTVVKISPSGAASTFGEAGNPTALAYGSATGDLYIGRNGGGVVGVYEYNASGTLQTSYTTATGTVSALAVDQSGDVWVANGTSINQLNAGLTSVLNTFTGFSVTRGLTFDDSGHLFVADQSGNKVYELPIGGSNASGAIGYTTVSSPYGVGVDANGTIFVTDSLGTDNHGVQEITGLTGPNTGTVTTFITYDPNDTADNNQQGGQFAFAPTPEPASLGLLGLGAVGLLLRSADADWSEK